MSDYTNTNMCQLPWTGIEIGTAGEYRPCCLYKNQIADYNAMTHSIKEVMNSKEMQLLRADFKANKRPAGCESCWKEEAAGKKSKRVLTWEKSPTLGEMHIKKDQVSPRYLEIRLGNICNLKCRICGPDSSSQWANENIKNIPNSKQENLDINERSRWPRKDNKAFDDIEHLLENVRYIQITGGEPLLIQEQFDILQKCIDLGVAHKIDVHYNTNGTVYPEKALKEIWPHFKRIELAFSIDDVRERFEYQRHPAKWSEVNENIKKISDANLPNTSIQICTTLNFFNAYYLDEMAHAVDEWNPDYWHINCLHEPIQYDVQRLQPHHKQLIVDKLSTCQARKSDIQTAINYIKAGPVNNSDRLLKITHQSIQQIDNVRNESYQQVFSEFYDRTQEVVGNQ